MQDQLAEAVERAARYGAPPKTFHVGPDAAVAFGTEADPFDGLTLTHWSDG